MITTVVIHFITMISGPSLWQYVWELRFIYGIQISHIFYLFLLFYTICQSIGWLGIRKYVNYKFILKLFHYRIRTGLHIRKNRSITVFWDESVSISPQELWWIFSWAVGSIIWCYTSYSFYSYPRPFYFSIHLTFAILYVSNKKKFSILDILTIVFHLE